MGALVARYPTDAVTQIFSIIVRPDCRHSSLDFDKVVLDQEDTEDLVGNILAAAFPHNIHYHLVEQDPIAAESLGNSLVDLPNYLDSSGASSEVSEGTDPVHAFAGFAGVLKDRTSAGYAVGVDTVAVAVVAAAGSVAGYAVQWLAGPFDHQSLL